MCFSLSTETLRRRLNMKTRVSLRGPRPVQKLQTGLRTCRVKHLPEKHLSSECCEGLTGCSLGLLFVSVNDHLRAGETSVWVLCRTQRRVLNSHSYFQKNLNCPGQHLFSNESFEKQTNQCRVVLLNRKQSESTSDHTQKTCSQSSDQAKPSILKSKNKDGCTKSAHRVDFDPSKYGVRFYFVDGDSECSAGSRGVWSYVSDLASKFQAWYKSVVHNTEQFDQNKESPRGATRRGRSNPHNSRSCRRFRSVPTRRACRFEPNWENWPLVLRSCDKAQSHDRPEVKDWRARSGRKSYGRPLRDNWRLSREAGEPMADGKQLQQEGHSDREAEFLHCSAHLQEKVLQRYIWGQAGTGASITEANLLFYSSRFFLFFSKASDKPQRRLDQFDRDGQSFEFSTVPNGGR